MKHKYHKTDSPVEYNPMDSFMENAVREYMTEEMKKNGKMEKMKKQMKSAMNNIMRKYIKNA